MLYRTLVVQKAYNVKNAQSLTTIAAPKGNGLNCCKKLFHLDNRRPLSVPAPIHACLVNLDVHRTLQHTLL